MSVSCEHCKALLWPGERKRLCCNGGKVKSIDINFCTPPEPLRTLMLGLDSRSISFLSKIRAYNAAYQMSSLGINERPLPGWNPNIRIQGQMYHLIGSLLPATGEQPKYSQIYFCQEELERRSSVFNNLDITILSELQDMLHEHNSYVRSLRVAKQLVESGNYSDSTRIVIHEDRVPAGEHRGRFNRPQTHEVYALLPEQNLNESRDVILHVKEGGLQRISELSPAYDCVSYPLLLPMGTGGWSLKRFRWSAEIYVNAFDFSSIAA